MNNFREGHGKLATAAARSGAGSSESVREQAAVTTEERGKASQGEAATGRRWETAVSCLLHDGLVVARVRGEAAIGQFVMGHVHAEREDRD